MDPLTLAAGSIAPSICVGCRSPVSERQALCRACRAELDAAGPVRGEPPGAVASIASVAAHEGLARKLVISLKFGRLLPLAVEMAGHIADACPAGMLAGSIVAVPPAPMRLRWRGFDPAAELAAALGDHTGLAVAAPLRRRRGGSQRGRSRARRLGEPPRIEAVGEAPRAVLLVDDVITTGATLTACARALRAAGARTIRAATFTRVEGLPSS